MMTLDAQKLAQLLASIASFSAALKSQLAGKLDLTDAAADTVLFEGKTLAQIKAEIEAVSDADLAVLQAQVDAFIARRDNPNQVTKAQVGLGLVDNFATASNAETLAGVATDKFLVPANLMAFWADKVGSAPATLDTIAEIAAALENNPAVVDALRDLVAGNTAAITALEADLSGYKGTNNTAVAAADAKAVAAQGTADAAVAAAAVADGKAVVADGKAVAAQTAADTAQAAAEAAQVTADSKLAATAQAVDSAKLDGKTRAEIIAEAQAGVDLSQVVLKSDDFGVYKVGAKTINAILLEIQEGSTESIADLRAAIDAFVAAKATEAEAIAGTDNTKYITALALKAKVDAAINAVVDGAPQALDTLKELALALADQEDAVAALVTVIDTKLNQDQVEERISIALEPVNTRLDIIESLTGTDTPFLRSEIDDLGANPVGITADSQMVPSTVFAWSDFSASASAGVRNVRLSRTGGTVVVEADVNGDGSVWEVMPEAGFPGISAEADAQLSANSAVDGTQYYAAVALSEGPLVEVVAPARTLKQHIDRIDTEAAAAQTAINARVDGEVAGLESNIAGVQAGLQGAIAGVQAANAANTNAINNVFTQLDGRLDTVEAALPSKLEAGDNIDTNLVTYPDADTQAPTAQTLVSVLGQLKAAVEAAESGAADDVAALQTAFNAFVAAKASAAEAIAGTDDTKYITSLALKAKVDNAVSALVDGAPLALDTLKELATALENENDAVAALTVVVDGKLGKTEQAADSLRFNGKTQAELTATEAEVIAGAVTDKFVTPATLYPKQQAQDLAIQANSDSIDGLVAQMITAFNNAATDIESAV